MNSNTMAEDKNKPYEVPVIIDDTELGYFEGTTAEFEELISEHEDDETHDDE